MGDGRTDLFRNMWTRTTTNDVKGASLEEQAKHTPWETEHLLGKDVRHMPDQYKHKVVSFIKSGVRILGFGVCWWSLDIGLTLLILAEVIGVGEELV